MDIGELELYTEALACLKQTLYEGKKDSNVDIQLMLSNIQRCQTIVRGFIAEKKDSVSVTSALLNLELSLCCHVDILMKKIHQLNSGRGSSLISPSTISSSTSSSSCTGATNIPDGNGEDVQKKNRRSAISDTIVKSGTITFDDVAGLQDAKTALREAIIMPFIYPHLFTGGRKPWKRILLYGPPGTGKSRLAQAIASEIKSTFYCVSSADIISSWVGESEKLIKELFCHATSNSGRSVIFIDEIDSITRQRNTREEEHTRRIKTELLKQMEGADNSDSTDKIFLLCATNCPWELDVAFLRRFQKRIYIQLPERDARIQLMKLHCHGSDCNISENEWNSLADATEGYSGSDIATMTLGALFQPIRDLQVAKFWHHLPDGKFVPTEIPYPDSIETCMTDLPPDKIQPREVSHRDFIKSLQTHRKTVSDEELKKFETFTKCYGESG
ncbi:uncharacterized protein LOC126816803 [Patella vulgata]|uniref:uncharacterized protein LOC126816803 n=1 Tax=Patella vulgata TaxID=6465 RepID=UPI0021809B73|nr:uncharacterized protein LOC126816803 [Patella vulgata]